MGEKTGIQWTDATWNCWQGCHKVSAGCKFCYMFREKQRYGQDPNVVKRSSPATFNMPLSWALRPEKYGHIKRVFTCSWSDFFIAEADPWREEAWHIIRKTPQFTYQILTKRPERIKESLPHDWGKGYPNVWIGTSVENQDAADKRIPLLRCVPAAVHFLSCEPLLGPLDLTYPKSLWPDGPPRCCNGTDCGCMGLPIDPPLLYGIGWVICGGESGFGARPMVPAWAQSLRDQCVSQRVPYFFKQWGAYEPLGWCRNAAEGEDVGEEPGRFIAVGDYSAKMEGRQVMKRVSKKSEHALLDDIEWHQFPTSLGEKP